ncbi:PhoX family protein [Salinispirillum marinum]|uniref:PhoX family protein n=2 Tax=Saccharospirillaceae TaxID=255527 RepID=A0ABV8BIW1_9GAMM
MVDDNNKPVEFDRLIDSAVSRRSLLKMGGAVGATAFMGGVSGVAAAVNQATTLMSFDNIPTSTADDIMLPPGYRYDVLMSWGDPVLRGAPEFSRSNNAEAQAGQFGDNTDGMELYHLTNADGSMDPNRAVLAVNSEYYNDEYLFTHGEAAKTADDVRRGLYAHGVTVVELERNRNGEWAYKKSSNLNRRLHGYSEFELTGPVAGTEYVKTSEDTSGRRVLGTLNNCGASRTPWGTYLTCEENFNGYFGAPEGTTFTPAQQRYGLSTGGFGYQWWPHERRFNVAQEPNEANRFGWIVEIDPMNPNSTPKKRTALGRFKHENAAVTINKDGRAVVYMGDDERAEFIYKFVSRDLYDANNPSRNADLLEQGTLYAARFNENGSGDWLELTFGRNGLTPSNGFRDEADVLVRAREAATFVGATTMDRPEWVTVHPSAPMVLCALTNNSRRTAETTNGPNPRAENHFGQIVRWTPHNGDHTSDRFGWDLYAVAGNPTTQTGLYAGSDNITAENMFNSPDGLAFDRFGRLWIQTDGNFSNEGRYAGQGNNMMLCGDPVTGHIRRFMVGPVGCEVTGITFSDDHRAMMVGIQHPTGAWPNAGRDGVPRSSVITIYREDGGVIGA